MSMSDVPNFAGKAMTVKGPIDPEELGRTIMHEHLFIDFWRDKQPDFNAPATLAGLWDQKLTLENLHFARDRKRIKDNYLLTDENVAVKEAMEFKRAGGNTIVDVTSIGLGRDPMALQQVADATGLNIVMGAGWYQKFYHPDDMDQRTVEDLRDEIIGDIAVGVGGTGVRSGIIGEVGINGNPLTPNEMKSVRASAEASRATGAAITFHHGGWGKEKLEVASAVAEAGGDLTRTVFGHSDGIAGNMELMLGLLRLGAYIEFDLLGRVNVPLTWKGELPAAPTEPVRATTAVVADAIPRLIEAGYEDKIVLAQDCCMKIHLKAYGGSGYSYVLERFLPFLISQGVTEHQANKLMVENPRRILTLVEPS